MKKITICIAAKNEKKFVSDFKSFDHERIEWMFADAGSTDGTDSFMDRVPQNKGTLRITGVFSDAEMRNGLLHQCGTEYIWFCNLSMCVTRKFVDNMLAVVDRYTPDIIAFEGEKYIGERKVSTTEWLYERPELLTEITKKEYFEKIHPCQSPVMARIYRKEFLESDDRLRFVKDMTFDDAVHNWISTNLAKRVVVLPDIIKTDVRRELNPWYGGICHADVVYAMRLIDHFIKSEPKYKYLQGVFEKKARFSIEYHLKRMNEMMKEGK